MNKKIVLIFVLLVLVPLFVSFFIELSLKFFHVELEVKTINQSRMFLLSVAFLGNAFIIWKNYSTAANSVVWYMIGLFFLILSALFLYILNSLSNFGF